MRDFRDAKAMAHTLRAALATRGHNITISQSLELIAQAFGVSDWNTLSAAIRQETLAPRKNVLAWAGPPLPVVGLPLSAELQSTLHRAIAHAQQRQHRYATLEHLLLALIDDVSASAVMKACHVDTAVLKQDLIGYIDDELKSMVNENGESRPTAAFHRVLHRAGLHAQGRSDPDVTGAGLLVAIFSEHESHAAYFLGKQMTRQDALSFIVHGLVKGGGAAA